MSKEAASRYRGLGQALCLSAEGCGCRGGGTWRQSGRSVVHSSGTETGRPRRATPVREMPSWFHPEWDDRAARNHELKGRKGALRECPDRGWALCDDHGPGQRGPGGGGSAERVSSRPLDSGAGARPGEPAAALGRGLRANGEWVAAIARAFAIADGGGKPGGGGPAGAGTVRGRGLEAGSRCWPDRGCLVGVRSRGGVRAGRALSVRGAGPCDPGGDERQAGS
jgi:hypothetical protein